MQELANFTNERVYLAIPHDGEVVYLEATYPAESVNLMRSILGERADMHCTGIGKAMLANLSEEEINEYVNMDEPYDKAGAYAIQGYFQKYIEKY